MLYVRLLWNGLIMKQNWLLLVERTLKISNPEMPPITYLDIQFKDKQFTRGKSIDTFAPCGPWITTKDEINDPQNLQIVTKVNGEIRQNSSSSKMVISIERIISSLSKVMTLEAGDIISTGTPAGVAMSMKEPKYLKNGDIVEITIENLGTIRNRITFA